MSIIFERADELEGEVRRRLSEVQLIGELPQALASEARKRVQDLYGCGESPHGRWPTVLVLAVVDIAAKESDGRELWPIAHRELTKFSQHPQDLAQFRLDAGSAFENILRDFRLPEFRHLREQGARRFLTPILAHALIPRKLVPALLDKVVRPLVQGSDLLDYSPADLRRRFERDDSIPVAVSRFLFDGGPVARDLLERIILYVANGCQNPTRYDLPQWLVDVIDRWAASTHVMPAGTAASTRIRGPVLRYESAGQVQVELPYLEGDEGRWILLCNEERLAFPAHEPQWRRDGPRRIVPIEQPISRLTVQLERPGAATRTWTLAGDGRPALFFSYPSGQAILPGGALHGGTWYVLAPTAGLDWAAAGARVIAACGEPQGWDGWEVDLIEAPSAEELSLGGTKISVAEVPPGARVEAHPSAPAYVVPLDSDFVAGPVSFPTVCLPTASTTSWEIRCVDGTGREVVRTGRELTDDFGRLPLSIPLDQILPPGTGTWEVTVRGRLGEGTSARVAVLPSDWHVPEPPVSAEFAGTRRELAVHTRSRLSLLERSTGDTLVERADGGWLVGDADGNGRVAIEVRDTAGDAARILIRFPTIRWSWPDTGSVGEPRAFLKDELRHATLAVRSDVGTNLAIELRDAGGTVLQRQETGSTVSVHTFALDRFSTTARALEGPGRLVLCFGPNRSQTTRETPVADVVLPAGVHDLRVMQSRGNAAAFEFHWRQENPVQVNARLADELRPWDDFAEEDVERADAECRATFHVQPGVYRFELWHDDPWSGPVCVHRELVETGSPDERRQRFAGRREDGSRTRTMAVLSLALLESPGKTTSVHLGGLLDGHPGRETERDPVAEDVVCLLACAVTNGVSVRMAQVPWWTLGEDLAGRSFDCMPLVEAVAKAVPTPELRLSLLRMLVGRWRSARPPRLTAPDTIRSGLWGTFPPLAAAFDLADLTDAAVGRLEHHLGLSGDMPKGPAGWADFLDCDPSAPAGKASSRDAAARPIDWPDGNRAMSAANGVITIVRTKLGWDPGKVRRPHEPPVADARYLSIMLACLDRLIGRGIVGINEARGAARLTDTVATLVPGLFTYDLCIAEGIVASIYGRSQ